MGWGRMWVGRSYDLGKRTIPEPWRADLTNSAIQTEIALASVLSSTIVPLAVAAPILLYPFAWCDLSKPRRYPRIMQLTRGAARAKLSGTPSSGAAPGVRK